MIGFSKWLSEPIYTATPRWWVMTRGFLIGISIANGLAYWVRVFTGEGR